MCKYIHYVLHTLRHSLHSLRLMVSVYQHIICIYIYIYIFIHSNQAPHATIYIHYDYAFRSGSVCYDWRTLRLRLHSCASVIYTSIGCDARLRLLPLCLRYDLRLRFLPPCIGLRFTYATTQAPFLRCDFRLYSCATSYDFGSFPLCYDLRRRFLPLPPRLLSLRLCDFGFSPCTCGTIYDVRFPPYSRSALPNRWA